ncbi:autotransporter outer membrane beta-barrel domain-containing protein [Pseudomonas lijiangensis]|uniref:Autotransporter outer membrane beta-barrel domain-containing protein n=1 Tax=Pseudomonas lijiangensis TaxID=2995658 RepID=A0ABX8I361_9PSED|nr:autotransporter outer membrane beta-barrel domain-containing protein [Pseudomonas lijiangensis]
MCFSTVTVAGTLQPGEVKTINATNVVERWTLAQDSTLTVDGAQTLAINSGADNATLNVNANSTTQEINLGSGSVAIIHSATITATAASPFGLSITNGRATLTDTAITSEGGIGLRGVQLPASSGSILNVTGGTVSGGIGGVSLSALSTLDMTGTQVTGTGASSYGIRAFSSDMTLRSSTIKGGSNGIQYRSNAGAVREGTVNLDGTHVEGGSGAAILIDGLGTPMVANLNLLNGTTLTGGNGNALEVKALATANVLIQGSALTGNIEISDGSTGNISLDQASLQGNITADGTSSSSLTLNNQSVFTGSLTHVDSVNINSQSQWNMTADNTVASLAMNGGTVKFGDPQAFHRLDVGTLSGNGSFQMDVDFATNEHDSMNVTGSATGSHTLLIAGSGVDPVSPEQLTMVQMAGGDAVFSLAGGAVDVGTWSYGLSSRTDANGATEWYLDPSKTTISPGTRSVLALFNTAPTVWYGELTSLRSRMGELRFNGGQAGGWVRAYGNKYDVADASGVGYQQNQQGFSLGADAPLPVGDGQWLIGVMAGHSTSDLNLNRGTSGTVKSYYLGTYATWLDQGSGYYFDGVIKFNRFRNEAQVGMSDGDRSKGDYDNLGVGGSVEFGRHIKLDNGYFMEPFTQLSGVVIRGRDYDLDNGMQASGDRTRSLLGKVGMTAGRNFTFASGHVVQPYVRVAGAHEFAKNNEVKVNDNVFNNDLSGSRGELGAGVAVAFSESLQVHADFDYAKGEHIEQPFGANVGLRYSW